MLTVYFSIRSYLFVEIFPLCYILYKKTCCRFCGGLPGRFVAGQFLRRIVCSSEFVLVARGVIALCGDCFELAPQRRVWAVPLTCH
jgi:hypothetical protein